jgi:hypothetical protein
MFERFRRDERAIEGLPIRLVIALVVGVASLSLMMSMLGGLEGLGVSEVDVQPSPEVVEAGQQDLALTVVGPNGDPVANATVVVKGGTAQLSNITTARTGADGRATVSVAPRLGPNQEEGTVVFDVKPPAGSEFVDRRENSHVLVVGQ